MVKVDSSQRCLRFLNKSIPSLISSIRKLEREIGHIVAKRVYEFKEVNRSGNEEWFSELCFCVLTANSTAELGIKIQNIIGKGFLEMERGELEVQLKNLGHRFWKKRAEYIVNARKFHNIKDLLIPILKTRGVTGAREWIVGNIKGIGYKEASHFLRNIGYFDVAILDRHILAIMKEYGIIEKIPSSLTRKKYLEIEKKFFRLSEMVSIQPGILDFYLWYMRTGKVLK